MTITAGRTTYVGTRRYDAVPARARAARHRRRPRPVVAFAAAAHRVRRAAARVATEWEARVTLRALTGAVVAAIGIGVLLGVAALLLVPPVGADRTRPTFQTPGPAAPTFTLPPR